MNKKFLIIGAFFGALAVALGAFGAHGLKEIIPAENLGWFETGNRYHFFHTFAILCCGLLGANSNVRFLNFAAWSFTIGILLFSGSLYLMAITGIKILGVVTPLGGLFFIGGWLLLAFSFLKNKN